MEAIKKEMEKDRPRKDVLLSLMKSTFYVRRQYILESSDPVNLKLEKYPALRMPPIVSKIRSSQKKRTSDYIKGFFFLRGV